MRQVQGNPVELKHILEAILKLCRDIDYLERNVSKLSGRIQPFEGEAEPQPKPWLDRFDRMPVANLLNIMIILRQAEKHVQNLEYDLIAIRSKLDEISGGSGSRADFKDWIDRHKG